MAQGILVRLEHAVERREVVRLHAREVQRVITPDRLRAPDRPVTRGLEPAHGCVVASFAAHLREEASAHRIEELADEPTGSIACRG